MKCRLASLIDEHNLKLSESGEQGQRLTQRKLAKEVGLAATTINRLYNNDFDRVDTNTIEILCDYFGCEISELFLLKKE